MSGPARIRVASYNTRDLLDDRRAAARVVRAVDPDVLCLQEVPRRLFGGRRVAAFAADCGLDWGGHHRGSGGTTIFTSPRVRVVQARHHRLHVALLQRTRGYAVATVVAPGHEPLTVASVHLSLRPGERVEHAALVLRDLADAGRVVLCGDLNEDETGDAWRLIADGLRLASPTTPTFPSWAPRRLLDVVFTGGDVAVAPHAPVALDPHDLSAASDHRPVWVDVVADPAGPGTDR